MILRNLGQKKTERGYFERQKLQFSYILLSSTNFINFSKNRDLVLNEQDGRADFRCVSGSKIYMERHVSEGNKFYESSFMPLHKVVVEQAPNSFILGIFCPVPIDLISIYTHLYLLPMYSHLKL